MPKAKKLMPVFLEHAVNAGRILFKPKNHDQTVYLNELLKAEALLKEMIDLERVSEEKQRYQRNRNV